ncbi:MAG: arginine repressor [Blastocatellia bacterium]|nr:arginine repressor [Blastocatellia bacterium]
MSLISDATIRRQDELAEHLHERGFDVTQASVSRDLDELGIVKVNGQYAQPATAVDASGPFRISAIEPAGGNLVVVRCAAGLASAVAVQIDSGSISEIVGTIAGYDTIFIAVAGSGEQKAVIRKLRTLFASA